MTWDHLHDEDVLFEFRGEQPGELRPGRFYRGTVDGFADFGVFVTIGDSVTGLLHRSNIDGRLENIGWDIGDEVIVQVEGVRENGNVDLTWSIRQSDTEFRGSGIHDPNDEEGASRPEPTSSESPSPTPQPSENQAVVAQSLRTISVSETADIRGDRVRLRGQVRNIRQTNGPTIFTIADETGKIECAAFEAAGVRAYPDIEEDDAVSVIGTPEKHRGSLQIECESLELLDSSERDSLIETIQAADRARARPEDDTLLTPDPSLDQGAIAELATTLREAVFDQRQIIIRHPSAVDGVVAAAAVEHSLRSLIEETHENMETSWLVTRRPMDDAWYDLGDAMYDVTDGSDRDALIVLVGAGDGNQDMAGLDFLSLYNTDHLVIDRFSSAATVNRVTPLASNLAGMVQESIRQDLVHLPAIAAGYDIPERYLRLALDHGYDDETIRQRHEALALVAYYQRYDDKRELIADLLFNGDGSGDLALHVSEQFRSRLQTAVTTARENAEIVTEEGLTILTLDASTLTHRFAFPPRPILCDALQRDADADIVVVLTEDAAFIGGTRPFDLDRIAEIVDPQVDHASVDASRDRLTFLAGKRDDVRVALVEALISQFE